MKGLINIMLRGHCQILLCCLLIDLREQITTLKKCIFVDARTFPLHNSYSISGAFINEMAFIQNEFCIRYELSLPRMLCETLIS